MISESTRKNNSLKFTGPILLALMLITMNIGISKAASTLSQGFAFKPVNNVRGTRVDMYTGNPSSPLGFIANLTAICVGQGANYPLGSYFFETGWMRGDQILGKLKHYISWDGTSEGWRTGITISANNWYQFQTLHSNSKNRWEGWIDGVPRIYLRSPIGFTSGNLVNCGLESNVIGSVPSATGWCNNTTPLKKGQFHRKGAENAKFWFSSNCRDRPICGGVVKQAVRKHDMIIGCGGIRI